MLALTTLFSELLVAAASREALEAALALAQVRVDALPSEPGLAEIEGQAALLRALEPCKPAGLLEMARRPTRYRGHCWDALETPIYLSSDGHVVYKLGGKLWRAADTWLVGRSLAAAEAREQVVAQLRSSSSSGQGAAELRLEPSASASAAPIAYHVAADARDYACCYASVEAALAEHAELGDRLQAQRMLLTGESINGLRLFRI